MLQLQRSYVIDRDVLGKNVYTTKKNNVDRVPFEFEFCHTTGRIHIRFTVRTIKHKNACFSSGINAGTVK